METKKIGPETVKKLNDKNGFARAEAAYNKLPEQEVGRLLTDPEKSVRLIAVRVQELTDSQITAVLKHEKDYEVRRETVIYQKLKESHLDTAISDSSPNVIATTIRHYQLNHRQADKALLNDESEVGVAMARYQKGLLPRHIDEMQSNGSPDVRKAAAEFQVFNKDQADKALSDENKHVRMTAVLKQDLNPEQIERAFSDEDKYVRKAVSEKYKISIFKRLSRSLGK